MKTIICFVLVFALVTCKSDPQLKNYIKFAKNLTKGELVANVYCSGDMQQSYALFLPKSYTVKRKYPVVFCFDPHGDGSLPVNLLKEEAEVLGYILVGSNTIRNGMAQEVMDPLVTTMINDVHTKINVDNSRMYMAGFSGGARVALAAMVKTPGIRGVIACSGSIPAQYIPQSVCVAGIAGSEDMNYAEMEEMEKGLESQGTRHILLTFEGTHGWPPKSVINSALQWFAVNEMKDNLIPKNDTIISRFINLQRNNATSLFLQHRYNRQIARTLNGLADVDECLNKIKQIETDPKFIWEITQKLQSDSLEKVQQQILAEAFSNKPVEWWRTKLKDMKKASEIANDKLEITVTKRLLAYVSLYSFSACNYAKNSGDKAAFSKFVEIYGLADPENPDYFYFQSCYYALSGNPEKCLRAVEQAIHFGFTNISKIYSDPLFSGIINKEGLEDLMKNKK